MKDILDAIVERRSNYNLSKESLIPDQDLEEMIGQVVYHTPSPNNMQSQRAILLLGENHDKLWDIVMSTLRAKVAPEKFAPTEKKVNGFKAGYGTVLFFDDEAKTKEFMEMIPLYADNFKTWAEHSNAMLQINLWNLLQSRGFAVNIQHYNPIIDDEVKETWDIPKEWRLIAQMPFGKPTGTPMDGKKFMPLEEKFKIYK